MPPPSITRGSPTCSYRLMHSATLLNPVAPTRSFASEVMAGSRPSRFWHNNGFGKVVAIYDPTGKLVKAYDLADLFPPAVAKTMPHSVSSIHWRGQADQIRQDQRTLYVHAANQGGVLRFGLETGRFTDCENHQGKQRCRSAMCTIGSWHSGNAMIDR